MHTTLLLSSTVNNKIVYCNFYSFHFHNPSLFLQTENLFLFSTLHGCATFWQDLEGVYFENNKLRMDGLAELEIKSKNCTRLQGTGHVAQDPKINTTRVIVASKQS